MAIANGIHFYLDAFIRSLISLVGYYTCRCRELVNPPLPKPFHHIVIVQLGHMGDMVLTLPLIEALKVHPDAPKVTVVAGVSGAEVIRSFAADVDVVVYTSKKYGRGFTPREKAPALSDCDGIIHLRGDGRMVLESFKNRRAFFTSGLAASNPVRRAPLYLLGIPVSKKADEHQFSTFRRAMGHIGVSVLQRPSIQITQDIRNDVQGVLSAHKLTACSYVVVHAGAPWKARRWPIERFAQVVRYLTERSLSVILIGSREERELADYFSAHNIAFIDLIGQLTLRQLAGVCNMSKLYIGNDSGPGHLAAAAGAVTIILFGPQDPVLFTTLSKRGEHISGEIFCSPCWQSSCMHRTNRCMESIPTEQVISVISALL